MMFNCTNECNGIESPSDDALALPVAAVVAVASLRGGAATAVADGFVFAVSRAIEIGDAVADTKGAIVGELTLLRSLPSSSFARGAATGNKLGLEAADFELSVGLPVDCECGEDAGESDMSAEDEIGSRSID
ncbi:uncharacterized protein IUM83_16577 [Phytophthora cinnamomi]|uniref:uncharacterized protein n=1 Tax=Phytophthora cinnamomi TaxID=4785 RepID=UPI00355AA331|nr:hypothetical protein IUM83_16577 [Phytophthora cinnamomi]